MVSVPYSKWQSMMSPASAGSTWPLSVAVVCATFVASPVVASGTGTRGPKTMISLPPDPLEDT